MEESLKILIVDDEPQILELFELELRGKGHQCFLALCGDQALELLKRESVDVIITDLNMPNGTGAYLIDEVHKLPKPPKIFVITGSDPFSVYNFKNKGIVETFMKPFDFEIILKRVEDQIKKCG